MIYTVRTITSNDVDEYDTHKFTAWASDLRWPVGHIPTHVQTTLGNSLDFLIHNYDEDKFVYRQISGCIELTVYND